MEPNIIASNYELCCICLASSNENIKTENNRLQFGMMNQYSRKKINVNIFICDICSNIHEVKKMNESQIINILLLDKIDQSIKIKLLKQCGII